MGNARRAVVFGFAPHVSRVKHGRSRHATAQDAPAAAVIKLYGIKNHVNCPTKPPRKAYGIHFP